MNKDICTTPSCSNYRRYCRQHRTETFKPAASLKIEADSKKDVNKEYKRIAKLFITMHPKCQMKGCIRDAECIHHMKGRIGELLTDTKFFLAVCLPCHQKIEQHSAWARQMGYSISRIKSKV